MEKELVIYKNGKDRFILEDVEEISGRHIRMKFRGDSPDFTKDDLLWSIYDKERNETNNMLVVDEVLPGKIIICRRANGDFLKNMLSDIGDGAIFTLMGSYKEKK